MPAGRAIQLAMDSEQVDEKTEVAARNAQILAMRRAGASWEEIGRTFGLTRQQARYGFQLAKRARRRAGEDKD